MNCLLGEINYDNCHKYCARLGPVHSRQNRGFAAGFLAFLCPVRASNSHCFDDAEATPPTRISGKRWIPRV
jgi:hypothetical protein